MVKTDEIYRCKICGNIVSVVEGHDIEIHCCGMPMNLMDVNTTSSEGKERHVPIVEKTDSGVKVTVGSIIHPMEEDHFISLIQVLIDNKVIFEKHLKSTDRPVAEFIFNGDIEKVRARALCNEHGLWSN